MTAFVAPQYGNPEVLKQETRPVTAPTGRDILVRLFAIATNPVDFKVINNFGNTEAKTPEGGVVAGYDGAGVVEAVGPDATLYKKGDEVYFSGVINRAGTFAEFTLVDERIVGRKPKSLSWVEAASVPLAGLTAWEGLVESLAIPVPAKDAPENKSPDSILVIGGAGGVGSLVIELAKHALKLRVIATASRPESINWCKTLGADLVIDHSKPLLPQLKAHGIDGVKYVYNTVDTVQYFDQEPDLVLPLGTIHNINGTNGVPLDIGKLMTKRIGFTFGLMFTRPLFGAAPEEQKKSLDTLADYLDNGVIKHVLTQQFPFTREGLVEALNQQKSGKTMGKIGLTVRK